jgi:glutamine cyclotransferase
MSKKSGKKKKEAPKPQTSSTPRIAIISTAVLMLAIFGFFRFRSENGEFTATDSPVIAKEVPYEVVNQFPHDPQAFLQGLVWYSGFFESTGQFGRSSLRRVEYPTGKVLQKVDLDSRHFGEGLAMVDDKLYQLTWQSHRGFVYDRDSFKLLREFSYDTEGWGLTYDGKSLILSDGTDMLTFHDPESFKPARKLSVRFNGQALNEINELEYINGEVWANVWHTDRIVRIDPKSGNVKSYLNLETLYPEKDRSDPEAVLNGIAYDANAKRIFISGKLWPRIYEIRLK